MSIKKRILIIGPYGKIGGVKTHVEQLLSIFKPYGIDIKVTRGAPFFQMIVQKYSYQPDVVIYNLSIYRNQILRNIITRIIMGYSVKFNILHLHGGNFSDVNLTRNPFFKKLLKLHFSSFSQIYCLTNEQYSNVTERFGCSKNVRRINNYVDIPNEAQLNKKDDNLNLLYIGRLHPLKGIREAISAVCKVKSERIRFWIIGSGELENELVQIKDKRIVFLGEKTGSDKEAFLSKAHVFLLPSWSEGLPYSLLEAAAYGLALVATPVGAINQVLYDGRNGYFINPGSVINLVKTIEKLLEDRSETLKMGKESRKICEERFSIKKLQKIYDKLFESWSLFDAPVNRTSSHV